MNESTRNFLIEIYNRTHRRAPVEQAEAVDEYIAAIEGIEDMTRGN